jgi:hypothetical protein
MDWDKLKKEEDLRQEKMDKIAELKNLWHKIDEEYSRLHMQFDKQSEIIKQDFENKAVADFKQYFIKKGFKIEGDNKNLIASYGDIIINFIIEKGHAYSLYFYTGEHEIKGSRFFHLQMARIFDGKYKQIPVEEIDDDMNLEEAEKQVQSLEYNKDSIDALLNDMDKISYVFKLNNDCDGAGGQLDNIEFILNTFK